MHQPAATPLTLHCDKLLVYEGDFGKPLPFPLPLPPLALLRDGVLVCFWDNRSPLLRRGTGTWKLEKSREEEAFPSSGFISDTSFSSFLQVDRMKH